MNVKFAISVTVYSEGQLIGSRIASMESPIEAIHSPNIGRIAETLTFLAKQEAKATLAELAAEEEANGHD